MFHEGLQKVYHEYFSEAAIIHKISETSSNFHVTLVHYGKGLISVFQERFASINKIFILMGGGWALGYDSMRFKHFPDIS